MFHTNLCVLFRIFNEDSSSNFTSIAVCVQSPLTNQSSSLSSSLSLPTACEEGNQQLNSMPPLDENFTASLERKSVSATSSDSSYTCQTCKLEFAGNEAYQYFLHRSMCGQQPAETGALNNNSLNSNLREKLSLSGQLNNNHLNSLNSQRAQSPGEPCSPKQRNSNNSSFFNQIGLSHSDSSLAQQLSKAVGLFQQQSTNQQLHSLAQQLTSNGAAGQTASLASLLNSDQELNLIDKLPSADFNAMLSLLQQTGSAPPRLPSQSKSSNSLSSSNAFQSKPNLSTNQQSSSLQKSLNRMPGEFRLLVFFALLS